ncbi:MAG: PASTA domain-containing protein [bacterium]
MSIKGFFLDSFKLLVFIIGLFVLGFLSALITINLVMQKEQAKVPPLVGKDVVDALEILHSLGLNLVVESREFHQTMPTNAVISQSPAAGKLLKSGRDIKVALSKGTEMVDMPAVVGEPLLRAQAVLQEYDLKTGPVAKIYRRSMEENIIIGQDPPAGSKVRRAGRVNLLVSRGQEPVYYCMPELSGKSVAEAEQTLQSFHLTIGSIDYEINEKLEPDTVIAQSPESGYRVLQGEKVNLQVSKERSIEDEIGTYRVLQYTVPYGSGRRKVRIILRDNREEKEIFHEERDAGAKIELLVKVKPHTLALIYLDGNLIQEEQF